MLLETTAKTQTKLTIYTAIQKFGVGRYLVFYVFERSPLCLPQLNVFKQKHSENSNIAKYNYYNLK